jgi:hypothetical protein
MHTDQTGELVEMSTATIPDSMTTQDGPPMASTEPAITSDEGKSEAKTSRIPSESFPDALAEEAYYGIVGDIVRTIEPHTEADPAALLMMTLVGCGAALGRGPHYVADGVRHGVNLFTGIVGESSKSRK